MKHKILYLAALLVVTFTIIFSSCIHFKPEINAVDPAFGKYISAYTSGMVSRKTAIRIELAQGYFETHPVLKKPTLMDSAVSIASIILPDSTLLEGVFSFEPEIKGKAIWISDRIIEFIPEQSLPVCTFYNVKFNLDELQEVLDDLETFRFQFSTYPQNLFVTVDGLRTYDDYNIEWQKLTGKLSTSDMEDTASIRKTLTVTQNGKQMPINLSYSYNANEFYFYVDSIERQLKSGTVVVAWFR
jgi:hypothetical protein